MTETNRALTDEAQASPSPPPSGAAGEDARRVSVPDTHLMGSLLGPGDEWLDTIEAAFPASRIVVRGNEIAISGPDAQRVGDLFNELVTLVSSGIRIDADVLRRSLDMIDQNEQPSAVLASDAIRLSGGANVRPKTAGQRRYIDAIGANIITFGLGPAGTGKSWLAVAMAAQALQRKQVERIVLTRPAVEAGERLGFLPGDLMAKVDPYLRPLYDAFVRGVADVMSTVRLGDPTDPSTDQGAVERFKAADPALIKEFLENQPGVAAADVAVVPSGLRVRIAATPAVAVGTTVARMPPGPLVALEGRCAGWLAVGSGTTLSLPCAASPPLRGVAGGGVGGANGSRAGGRSLPVRFPSTDLSRKIRKTATSPIRMMS